MKILAIYSDKFSYTPKIKSLEDADELSGDFEFEDVQVAFIQVEEHDMENPKSSEKKLLNFVKWVARNNNTKKILLHSFAHLSESKANPEFTKQMFDNVEQRLKNADYIPAQTPFGYFLDLNINAPGFSMARVFKKFLIMLNPLEKLNNYQIILASKSPRRKELLNGLDIKFSVEVRNVVEDFPDDINIEEIPEYLAKLKASAFPSQFIPDKQLVITADTIVINDGKVLGKPNDYDEAYKMIEVLSNSEHKVISGVCIKTNSREVCFSAESIVRFTKLNKNEIDYYIGKYKPFDKAGAYGIQEWIGMIGIDYIEGSFYNVMGLPTQKLYHELLKFIKE